MTKDNPLTYLIGLLCVIILLLFFEFGCEEDLHDELELFSTVCIDNVLYFSVATKFDLDYVPVIIDDKNVRCGKKY